MLQLKSMFCQTSNKLPCFYFTASITVYWNPTTSVVFWLLSFDTNTFFIFCVICNNFVKHFSWCILLMSWFLMLYCSVILYLIVPWSTNSIVTIWSVSSHFIVVLFSQKSSSTIFKFLQDVVHDAHDGGGLITNRTIFFSSIMEIRTFNFSNATFYIFVGNV